MRFFLLPSSPHPGPTLTVCSRTRVIDPNLSPCFLSCPHPSSSLSLNPVTNLVTLLLKSSQRLLNVTYGMAFKPLLIQEGGSPVFATSVYISHSFLKPSSTPTPDSSPTLCFSHIGLSPALTGPHTSSLSCCLSLPLIFLTVELHALLKCVCLHPPSPETQRQLNPANFSFAITFYTVSLFFYPFNSRAPSLALSSFI